MIGVAQAFSDTYAQARIRFLEAAAQAGLALHSVAHPLPGRDGEALALDVALDGPADAARLLLVSSACHGVEGFCGSGVQVFAVHDAEWREQARRAGVTVAYLHALNPHGFSWWRRVTHENVDLNRNFHDFSAPLPVNVAYAELHPLLLPAEWPPAAANRDAIDAWIARHGLKAYQAAVSSGQHAFADGLFYGGTAPTWSNTALRSVLRRIGGAARHIAWIDLHTGLGPSGVGERIFAGREDPVALQRARDWWGSGGATPITSIHDGTSTSARLTGMMWSAVYEECPQADVTGIALEYGTVPITELIDALRGDHWLHVHPNAPDGLRQAIKARIKAAFYVGTDAWRGQIVVQARQALFQAAEGLARC